MNKILSLLSALLVLAAMSSASAREGKTREETQKYGPPQAIMIETEVGVVVGSVTFDAGRARTVEVAVEDTASPATAFTVRQGERNLGTYCTSTPKPIDIAPRQKLYVHLFIGVCDGDPSFITTGLVRARFST